VTGRPDGAGGEYYRIHLGYKETMDSTAILSNLSFEGATRRNKPSLESGQVLYARIAESVPGMEHVLSCQLGPHRGSAIKSKDWMTNEGVYGILQGCTILQVSSGLARTLLSADAPLWESVTRHALTSTFEIAIGVNGLLWLHASPSKKKQKTG
jgi:exosome complex component RRP40